MRPTTSPNQRPLLKGFVSLMMLSILMTSSVFAQLKQIDSVTTQRSTGKVTVVHYFACSPFFMNGQMQSQDFYYNFRRGTEEVTYYITYTPNKTSTETKPDACDSYTWKYTSGQQETYTTTGTHTYTKTVSNAVCGRILLSGTNVATYTYGDTYCKCDSTKTLQLTLNKSSSSTFEKTACDS